MSALSQSPLDCVEFTPTGLVIRDALSYDGWAAVGAHLRNLTQALQWIWGDWILFGERCYGETYSQALEATNLSYQSIANFVYVAQAFPPDKRRTTLSWSHHAAVAGLMADDPDEAMRLLDAAEAPIREGMYPLTVAWLREQVQVKRGKGVGAALLHRVAGTLRRQLELWALPALVDETTSYDAVATHIERALDEIELAIALIGEP